MGKNEINSLPLTLTCFHLTWIEGETKYSITFLCYISFRKSLWWLMLFRANHHFGHVLVPQYYRNAFRYIMSVHFLNRVRWHKLYCTAHIGQGKPWTIPGEPEIVSSWFQKSAQWSLWFDKLTFKFSSDRIEGFKYGVIRCRGRGYPESPKNSPSCKPWLMKIINYHFFKLSVKMAISPNSGVITWARPSCIQGSFPDK